MVMGCRVSACTAKCLPETTALSPTMTLALWAYTPTPIAALMPTAPAGLAALAPAPEVDATELVAMLRMPLSSVNATKATSPCEINTVPARISTLLSNWLTFTPVAAPSFNLVSTAGAGAGAGAGGELDAFLGPDRAAVTLPPMLVNTEPIAPKTPALAAVLPLRMGASNLLSTKRINLLLPTLTAPLTELLSTKLVASILTLPILLPSILEVDAPNTVSASPPSTATATPAPALPLP